MSTHALTLVCLLLCGIHPLFGQRDVPIDLPRINGELIFDGRVDEAFWDDMTPLPLTMQFPNFGEAPTESADVYITYDDNYLYLAGRMSVSDSSYIRGTTYKRDAFDGTSDYFGFVIDSYNDNENALAFFTNSVMMRWDATVSNDATPANDDPNSSPVSIDWNTFWDVATWVGTDFWHCEMRIPFSSLRFQDRDGEVIMGMTMWWYLAGKNEQVIYPAVPLNWGDWSPFKPTQMQKFRLKGIYSEQPLYLAPYVLAGLQEENELNEAETGYIYDKDPTLEAGLDLKFGITSNLTLDLTVNTDFAQVEADDQQVNLTRFSLFFPEKRQFFLERASIFDFNFEGFNRLFYSRRIGIDDDGNPLRIYGGTRLNGRLGKSDIGAFSMQTDGFDGRQTDNFSLLRLRRQVLNANSYVGAMLSNRTDFKGDYNTVYGLDGIFRVSGNEYLSVRFAQSYEQGRSNRTFSLDPTRLYVNWERRDLEGFSYNLTFSRAGSDWSPGMGFELREDFTNIIPVFQYGWLPGEHSKVLRFQTFVRGQLLTNNPTGVVETGNVVAGFILGMKNGWSMQVFPGFNREFVREEFELTDDIAVPVGEYNFTQFNAFASSPFQYLFGAFAVVSAGGFFDGNFVSVTISPRLKFSSSFDLEGFYQLNRVNFPERGESFVSHLGRIKAQYLFNTKLSLAAFVQYNGLDEVFLGNFRLRYNPREGNDLFLVYNDLINSNREREWPYRPFSSNRTIVLKYTYTFQL